MNRRPRQSRLASKQERISIVRTLDDYSRVVAVRSIAYIDGQEDCPFDEEFDGNDFCAMHLIGWLGDEPAACLRVRFFSDFVKLERLAVRPDFRGSTLAFRLVRHALRLSARKGYRYAYGHAQSGLRISGRAWGAADRRTRRLRVQRPSLHRDDGGVAGAQTRRSASAPTRWSSSGRRESGTSGHPRAKDRDGAGGRGGTPGGARDDGPDPGEENDHPGGRGGAAEGTSTSDSASPGEDGATPHRWNGRPAGGLAGVVRAAGPGAAVTGPLTRQSGPGIGVDRGGAPRPLWRMASSPPSIC